MSNQTAPNTGVTDQPCPYCGSTDFSQWPNHVQDCPELWQ